MASEIDICNDALAHLGDEASVSSINPPDGSAQAALCARFYPLSRDSLLEMHAWGFATKRVSLALLTNTSTEWAYCYAVPSDMLNVLSVLASDATDDYSSFAVMPFTQPGTVNTGNSIYTPRPFSIETVNGVDVIYTDISDAMMRYTAYVTDTTKFSPLFKDALAWLLASKLAGPILKGDKGAQMTQEAYKMFKVVFAEASVSDANQSRHNVKHSVPWIVSR